MVEIAFQGQAPMDMAFDRVGADAMFPAEYGDSVSPRSQVIHHFQAQHAITADVVGRVVVGKH
jgi:hypothetical protein